MKQNLHKWKAFPDAEKAFPGTYRVEKCVKCSLLKLHEYRGKIFSHSYIYNCLNSSKMPECINIQPKKLEL